MSVVVLYLVVCVLPGVTFLVAERCYRAWTGETPWPRSRSTQAPQAPVVPHPPLERLVADLRRLDAEIARLELSAQPARVRRMEAVALAYDDTLRSCCVALEVPLPSGDRLDAAERLQVEADLAQAGLVW
ncbi:hypothetical protein PZ938_09595 [Luteipulveratus sp. YIM 133132]|uniref:hypothetical protein n=1 Tax=Luteipulveratus flavus TaxID=3031728 RepID=UPI0023B177E8|nr:hypothetical protein [Luteipulveratus sp. YIM 133132]MDE9365855.1 hypothetical protein [Luteipulveratus sp. YIM 133132]